VSKRERPPPIPPQISEYDGHDNYRERFKPAPFFVGLLRTSMILAGVFVGLSFGYSLARVVLLFDYSADSSGVVALIVYAVVGVVGFFGYVIALGFMRTAAAMRGFLAAGALFFVVMAFYPFAADYRPPRAPASPDDPAARAALLATLRAAGRVGAPGEVPPMLSVSGGEGWFDVTNRTASYLLVEIAQVQQNPRAADGWDRCELSPRSRGGGGNKYRLGPYLTMRVFGSGYCRERFGYSHLEFRVGDETTPAAETWWSDSAGP
jgi:hypothetical protein